MSTTSSRARRAAVRLAYSAPPAAIQHHAAPLTTRPPFTVLSSRQRAQLHPYPPDPFLPSPARWQRLCAVWAGLRGPSWPPRRAYSAAEPDLTPARRQVHGSGVVEVGDTVLVVARLLAPAAGFRRRFVRSAGQWNPIFASPKDHVGQAKGELELWALVFEKVRFVLVQAESSSSFSRLSYR